MIPTLAGFRGGVSAPPAPTLSYTADGAFTITNYSASLTYAVSGATRSGSSLTGVSYGATITAAYSAGAPVSNVSTMFVLANARVLYGTPTKVTSTGCGPRPDQCCPGGMIQTPAGNQCGGYPGSLAPDGFCSNLGTPCPGNCYQLTVDCYNWYWTNYTAEGYTLIGNTWGKAVNG